MIRVAALATALALGLAACGSDASDDTSADTNTAATELTLTLDPDGSAGEDAIQATVSCPGDAAAVCDAVAALPAQPTDPVPPETACTEIFGGPDTLKIEGTLRGERVSAHLTRVNGCEIDRFDRFTDLLAALFPDYRPGASLQP